MHVIEWVTKAVNRDGTEKFKIFKEPTNKLVLIFFVFLGIKPGL